MVFERKKVWDIKKYTSRKDLFTVKFFVKTSVVIASVIIIIGLGKRTLAMIPKTTEVISRTTARVVSKQIGEAMQKDEFGNINVLIVGYAGLNYRGAMLTDTMMLASFNPQLGAVTFLSIPRDLYVNYGDGRTGRINGVYRAAYNANEKSQEAGARALADKIWEITGIDIPYYAMVDFDGFVEFIDYVGGVEVDVPYALHDTSYPGPNDSYVTFTMEPGIQQLDGETALKYARSRKSTSDFSRALRQQQIIEWIVQKILSQLSITRIDYLNDVYEQGMKILFTNISLKQLLWLLQYMDVEKRFFSYVYSAACDTRYFNTAEPGCVLYFASKEAFGGASAILPDGATPGNLSYYRHTQDFAFRVVHNQAHLMEGAQIYVYNGIDKTAAKAKWYAVNGVAGQLAIDLKLKGFLVDDIYNTEAPVAETKIYVPRTWSYQQTIETLSAFVDYVSVEVSDAYGTGGVSIVLGDDYLNKL